MRILNITLAHLKRDPNALTNSLAVTPIERLITTPPDMSMRVEIVRAERSKPCRTYIQRTCLHFIFCLRYNTLSNLMIPDGSQPRSV